MPFTYYTPLQILRRSYTPDSFTLSESFDPISTQGMCVSKFYLLCRFVLISPQERWAEIRDSLTAGQEKNRKHHMPLFPEDSSPVRPPKRSRK